MALWDWLGGGRAPAKRVAAHLGSGHYADAWDLAETLPDAEGEQLRERVARRWLQAIVAIGRRGDDETAQDELETARERLGKGFGSQLEAARWQLEEIRVSRGLDPVWQKLAAAASVQYRRFYGRKKNRSSPRHRVFSDPLLMHEVRRVSGTRQQTDRDSALIDAFDEEDLAAIRDEVRARYPEDLWTFEDGSRDEHCFVRGALYLAASRPDLACFPLLEADDEPLVWFERARTAHALGYGRTAIPALQAFGEAVGHQQVRCYHTGHFLADLLRTAGRDDEARALES